MQPRSMVGDSAATQSFFDLGWSRRVRDASNVECWVNTTGGSRVPGWGVRGIAAQVLGCDVGGVHGRILRTS